LFTSCSKNIVLIMLTGASTRCDLAEECKRTNADQADVVIVHKENA
jgi:hypothetical protein